MLAFSILSPQQKKNLNEATDFKIITDELRIDSIF